MKTKHPDHRLSEEYITLIRNISIVFFHKRRGYSITRLAEIFEVDKSTISRVVQKTKASNKGLDALEELLK